MIAEINLQPTSQWSTWGTSSLELERIVSTDPEPRHHWQQLHQQRRPQRYQRLSVDRCTADSHYGSEIKDEQQKTSKTQRGGWGENPHQNSIPKRHPESTGLMELPSETDQLWLQIQILLYWCHLSKLWLIRDISLDAVILSFLLSSGV